MTKIKLADGTVLDCIEIEFINGMLKLTIAEKTVEELAGIFGDKTKTADIRFMTESGKESGYKTGFTSFAGICYTEDGTKTVELYQPADRTEARLSIVEGAASMAGARAEQVQDNLDHAVAELTIALAKA